MNVEYLERDKQPNLAYIKTEAQNKDLPYVLFLGGYRSDMRGTKASYLEDQCKSRGQGYVRFDYRGHGDSDGAFDRSLMGEWKQDALDIMDHVIGDHPVLLIGSSMGGWIGLLVARERSARVMGFIGIAAAPDFTESIYQGLKAHERAALHEKGVVRVPNDYSDVPYTYTLKFYEEAKAHLLLHEAQSCPFPMRLIQGRKDIDVPYQMAQSIQKTYAGGDCEIIPVDEGDHRLSRPEDLILLDTQVKKLSGLS